MFKKFMRVILIFLYKTFNLPRMSCNGCLKDDCVNRSYYKNKICYVRSKKL